MTKVVIRQTVIIFSLLALAIFAFAFFYNWHAQGIESFTKNIPKSSEISHVKIAAESIPFTKIKISDGYFLELDGKKIWIDESIEINSSIFKEALGCSKYAKGRVTTVEYTCRNLSATYAFFNLFLDMDKYIE